MNLKIGAIGAGLVLGGAGLVGGFMKNNQPHDDRPGNDHELNVAMIAVPTALASFFALAIPFSEPAIRHSSLGGAAATAIAVGLLGTAIGSMAGSHEAALHNDYDKGQAAMRQAVKQAEIDSRQRYRNYKRMDIQVRPQVDVYVHSS